MIAVSSFSTHIDSISLLEMIKCLLVMKADPNWPTMRDKFTTVWLHTIDLILQDDYEGGPIAPQRCDVVALMLRYKARGEVHYLCRDDPLVCFEEIHGRRMLVGCTRQGSVTRAKALFRKDVTRLSKVKDLSEFPDIRISASINDHYLGDLVNEWRLFNHIRQSRQQNNTGVLSWLHIHRGTK